MQGCNEICAWSELLRPAGGQERSSENRQKQYTRTKFPRETSTPDVTVEMETKESPMGLKHGITGGLWAIGTERIHKLNLRPIHRFSSTSALTRPDFAAVTSAAWSRTVWSA